MTNLRPISVHQLPTTASMKPARVLLTILGGWFGSGNRISLDQQIDWQALVELAQASKTSGLLTRGIQAQGFSLPSVAREALNNLNRDHLKENLFNLGWMIKAAKAIADAGVEVIAFKGPVRSHSVYGAWDKRRSSDIDFLVHKKDYERAAYIFGDAGYVPMVSSTSKWWHEHLGESPFMRLDGSGVVIDLHHQIQQPGGPYPAHMDEFCSSSEVKKFGNETLRLFSERHSTLVAAISYGKAVRAGTHWLHHAHELAFEYYQSTPEDRRAMHSLANHHKLGRLYDEAISNALTLFAVDELTEEMPESNDTRDELLKSSLGWTKHPHFYRTRKFWGWLDGNVLERSAALGGGMLRVFRSEMVQKFEERHVSAREVG